MPLTVLGVIPARFDSTRFPGKPLALIQGKPMILWVVEAALKSKKIHKVVVATDDQRILNVVQKHGFLAVMTDASHPSGSDRVWQVAQNEKCDVVLNIQGDEPLLIPELLDQLIQPFEVDLGLESATLAQKLKKQDLADKNKVKVIQNQDGNAIYFSRFPIPYSRKEPGNLEKNIVQTHLGLYAYQKSFLQKYCKAGICELEEAESLEQLRVLWLGARMKVVSVEAHLQSVDQPDDIQKVEKILKEMVE